MKKVIVALGVLVVMLCVSNALARNGSGARSQMRSQDRTMQQDRIREQDRMMEQQRIQDRQQIRDQIRSQDKKQLKDGSGTSSTTK